MGTAVKTAPLLGMAMVAPRVGGAVEIVPCRPIEPDPGPGLAAQAV